VRWRFGEFALDLGTLQLTCGTRDTHLSPKALELLAVLIAHQPNAVSKADLVERLWPGTYVVEANLSNLVGEIRAKLDDRSRSGKYIRTVHGVGYAFCGDARAEKSARTGRVHCWLEWAGRRFPLPPGEHVIGRDPDADVRLDSTSVSRRHARLMVSARQTTLEDFGSKNGTFVGDARITAPTALADGDAIRIGSLLVTYHVRTGGSSTATVAPTL
jgi:DNA-binding winged helix-turn-helix (wHTH) protein